MKEAVGTTDLTKKYQPPGGFKRLLVKSPIKQEILAVDKVSLSVAQGELFGLIGPNGAGKTTLIKMLATLLLPTAGTAEINGFNVVKEEGAVKASIGFVSGEERSFYWRLSGRENLMFFAALQNLGAQAAKERIDHILKVLRLDRAADDMYYGYSSGMKQKLMIARGLLTDPKILFLDEPTKSVDAISAREIKQLIREEIVNKQGRTVFLTSHRLEEVEELCDRIAIMDKGKIHFVGAVAALRQEVDQKEHYFIEIKNLSLGHFEDISRACGLNSTVTGGHSSNLHEFEFTFKNGRQNMSEIIGLILEHNGEIVSFDRRRPNLEEMFVKYLERSVN